MNMEDAAEGFGALAQETRLRICALLARADTGALPAGDIALALGIAQNTLSFHLSQLERAGILRSRRQGRFIIYSLDGKAVDRLIMFLADTCRAETGRTAKSPA